MCKRIVLTNNTEWQKNTFSKETHFWHHSNTFRFAVVLFLLTEGECEREMGGNPLPPLTLR